MTQPSNDPRVAEAGYLGFSALSDDIIDVDDLYEALINPHAGDSSKGGSSPAGGMMMPPMGMMGGGGGAGGAGGPAGAGLGLPLSQGSRLAAPGMTGAGGGGLGADGTVAAEGEDSTYDTGGEDLGAADVGGDYGAGDLAGSDLGGGEDLGGDAAMGGSPDLGGGRGPDDKSGSEAPVAHSGQVMSDEAKRWQEIASFWPVIHKELESLTGQGGDVFGLVHELEHGFNETHVWLIERAREAGQESLALGDAVVDALKKWEQTEHENAEQAREITREVES